MDEAKRYRITVLADALHDKQNRYHMLGLANTPTDPAEARKARIEYALARAEYLEAQAELDAAMQP